MCFTSSWWNISGVSDSFFQTPRAGFFIIFIKFLYSSLPAASRNIGDFDLDRVSRLTVASTRGRSRAGIRSSLEVFFIIKWFYITQSYKFSYNHSFDIRFKTVFYPTVSGTTSSIVWAWSTAGLSLTAWVSHDRSSITPTVTCFVARTFSDFDVNFFSTHALPIKILEKIWSRKKVCYIN